MEVCFILLFLSSLIANGVFGDEVKSVSVMEGQNVILHTDTVRERDDKIVWYYGPENTVVARINGKADSIMYSGDERFRDRVKLNNQTGDLIITHITSQHSGLYTLKISRNMKVSYKTFNLTVYGEVKSVSVMEGHSVILYTHVLKQSHDLIKWFYGSENTCVATIDVEANSIMYSDDERFSSRLKMDDQTGALMIHDTTTHHSGLYTIIINNKVSYKTFNVTISGEVKSVSVREGHSVILYTHVLKERNDLVVWTYGPENTLVVKINETTSTPSTDKRFRNRVMLEDQTGALMIHDIRAHHSGLYQFRINSNNKVFCKKFDVTLHVDSHIDSRVLWVSVLSVVLLLICVCVYVYLHWDCVCKPRGKSQFQTDDESSMNSSITLNTETSEIITQCRDGNYIQSSGDS